MMISQLKSMLRRTPEESSQFRLTSPVRELTLSRHGKGADKSPIGDGITGVGSTVLSCRLSGLAYKVNELQRLCKPKATVSDLRLANRVVELSHQNQNMKLVYKANWIDWKDLAVVTYSDASFANEPGFKSQQGRIHYLSTASHLTEKDHNIHVIGFASSTVNLEACVQSHIAS